MLTQQETESTTLAREMKRLESGQSASDSVWDDEMGRAGCDQLFFVTSYRYALTSIVLCSVLYIFSPFEISSSNKAFACPLSTFFEIFQRL